MLFFKKKEIPLNELFPQKFVDIHSHLLPGIDDGAKDLESSIALIEKMNSYGIYNFVTTPHILGDVYPNTPEIIKEKLKLVKDELQKRNMTNVSFKAAAEYMMDEQFMKLLENDEELLTIKDNLVLVEMSFFNPPFNLYDILFKIQLKGYKPLLAHPERYVAYHNNHKEFVKLKRAGCLFQLNLLSLTKHYGKGVQKTAEKLLSENQYDFVGTDTHHQNHLELLKEIGTEKTRKSLKVLLEKNTSFYM